MSQVNSVFRRAVATVSTTKTLAEADSGVVQNVTASTTITLPATAAGYQFVIRVGADSKTIAVSPAAADKIMGNGFTSADNKDLIFTSARIGDFVRLVGDGVNGYFVAEIAGTATREA
jgi:hypothetical protein